MGERIPTQEKLLLALSGENAAAITVPEDSGSEGEGSQDALVEVYTPIIFPGATQPAGVLEGV